MKSWMWSLFVVIVTFVIITTLKIPFWLFLFIVVPALIIILTYGSFSYSFRPGLNAEAIPDKGYESRICDLDSALMKVSALDFEKFDAFYMKMVPDSIVYALKHKAEPIYLCLYHLGARQTYDIFTRYDNGFTLTSCSNVDSGMTPHPPKNLLQIVKDASYEQLFAIHKKAHKFVTDQGLRPYEIAKADFRNYFVQNIRDYARHVRKYPFWPILLVFWTVTKHGRIYYREIETQCKLGMIKFYDR